MMLDHSRARTFSIEAFWKGELTPIEVQFVPLIEGAEEPQQGRLLFTPEGDETHWLLSAKWRNVKNREPATKRKGYGHTYHLSQKWEITDEELAGDFKLALATPLGKELQIARRFELPYDDGERTFCVVLRFNGPLYLELGLKSDNSIGYMERVVPPVPLEELKGWSNARIESWLQEEWNNPGSQLHWNIRFLDLEWLEGLQIVADSIAGLNELHQLMRWGLQCDGNFIEHDTEWILVGQWLNRSNRIPGSAKAEMPPYLAKLGDVLMAHFLPLPPPQLLSAPYENIIPGCIDASWNTLKHVKVTVNPPTAHERVEAGLNLRDWLRKNASPEEFEDIWSEIQRQS